MVKYFCFVVGFLIPQLTIINLIIARIDNVTSPYIYFLFTYVLEGLIAAMIFLFLSSQEKRKWNFIAICFYTGYILIISIQYLSLENTFSFLPKIAIENTDNIGMVTTLGNVLILLSALIFLTTFLIWFFYKKRKGELKSNARYILFALCITLMIDTSIRVYAKKILTTDEQNISNIEFLMISHYSPVRSMLGLFYPQLTPMEYSLIVGVPSHGELENLKVKIKPEVEYPLIKDFIYTSDPFLNTKVTPKPHIIVIFVEGFSARTINYYDQTFEHLTPHITDFAEDKNSLVIHNYFNHTAATFRGLHGQLCSLYPASVPHSHWRNKKFQADFYCLPDYLNELHYESVFLDPHLKKNDYLNDMLQQLGFDRVMTADTISSELLSEKKADPNLGSTVLRNDLLFEAIYNKIKNWSHSQKPQLLVTYPMETHAWFDTKNNGVKYDDGNNNALNTIYDLDVQFGKFWEKFRKLDIYKNTVLIFTTDHARYHEASYIDAIIKRKIQDYQFFFADKIPLIIHDPRGVNVKDFDAMNATSIDFTPSIIHFLGFPNTKNPFVGSSIFERNHTIGLINIGKNYYITSHGRMTDIRESSEPGHIELKNNISEQHKLIYENRIWSRSKINDTTKN